MVDTVAEARLHVGLRALEDEKNAWEWRQQNYEGEQQAPFAPDGVNLEYKSLQEQSMANWLGIAMDAPVQRLAAESLRKPDGSVDKDTWSNVWLPNDLASLEKIVLNQMMVHGRGIWSVSKNRANPKFPRVRVENSRRVYMHRDPEDPFRHLYAVKTFTLAPQVSTKLWTPASASAVVGARQVGIVYDDKEWIRFEKTGSTSVGGWVEVNRGEHGLGELPFVQSASNLDADGKPRSAIAPLIPMQNALNTIRFNTLLAMQFSAYRQRVFTGYDPVVRDGDGNVIYLKNSEGVVLTDGNGQPVPMLNAPGRVGVDRALVFPGKDTNVFDLDESNLDNYVKVYVQFMTDLFAIGQIPPQYALTKMANLSGEALAGAESTLQSLIIDLKREAGSGIGKVMRLANIARGHSDDRLVPDWADTEPRSFAQVIDGVVKLISVKFPRQAAFEMLPGATPTKVTLWMDMFDKEQESEFTRKMIDGFTSDPSLDDETAPAA